MDREELEGRIRVVDDRIDILIQSLEEQRHRRRQLWMALNRAHRLEREELQNGKQ